MLRDEIKGSMQSMVAEDDRILARFVFPTTFTGFAGHFPGNPVLPGICTLQCVQVILGEHLGADARIVDIASAKFFSVVLPDEPLDFVCRPVPGGARTFRIEAQSGDRRIAALRLSVRLAGEPENTGGPA